MGRRQRRDPWRRAIAVLLGGWLVLVGVSLMASYADAGDPSMTVLRADGSVVPVNGAVRVGERISLRLSGFAASTTVVVVIGPTQLAPAPRTDASGAATVPVTVPKLAPASYVISATSAGMTMTTLVTVVPATTTPSPSSTPSASEAASTSTSTPTTTPSATTSASPALSATALARTGLPAALPLSASGAALVVAGAALVMLGAAPRMPRRRHVRVAGAHARRH